MEGEEKRKGSRPWSVSFFPWEDFFFLPAFPSLAAASLR